MPNRASKRRPLVGGASVLVPTAVFPFALFLALASSSSVRSEDAGAAPSESLSDALRGRISALVMGWGEVGWNSSVRPVGREAVKLQIGETTYERGIGHHAVGEIIVDLAGEFESFRAEIGIQWQGGSDQASVVFEVWCDDELRFASGIVRENDPARKIDVPVQGVEELRLVATDAGDGITCDCANWAEARLVRASSTVPRKPRPRVDVAPFARFCRFDPRRTEGTRASRIESMPREDVFPAEERAPESGGGFRIEPGPDGRAAFGLWWHEGRFLKEVGFEIEGKGAPPVERFTLERFTGESPWQGKWEAVARSGEASGGKYVWTLLPGDIPGGTNQIRWVVSGLSEATVLASVHAFTHSRWRVARLRIEPTALEPRGAPQPGPARIRIHNGAFEGPLPGTSGGELAWDGKSRLEVGVLYSLPRRYKGDRTILEFAFDGGSPPAFGVAPEDAERRRIVRVPHAGLLVRALLPSGGEGDAGLPPGVEANLAPEAPTVLAQVRAAPEASLEEAMRWVHDPLQDQGPMMLSLARDNRKYVAFRDGTVSFEAYDRADGEPLAIPERGRLVPRVVSKGEPRISRTLAKSWRPIPATIIEVDGLRHVQWTLVAPVDEPARDFDSAGLFERAVCVVSGTLSAEKEGPETLVRLEGLWDSKPFEWKTVDGGLAAESAGRILAFVDTRAAAPLEVRAADGAIEFRGRPTLGTPARWTAYLPAWKAEKADLALFLRPVHWPERAAAYWDAVLAPAMSVSVPDSFLSTLIRASQAHCLLAARCEAGGARVAPWISSDRYGPLESESNSIIRGMGFFGHEDFARRSLDFFLERQAPEGYITTGYTLVGTGECLWTLAEEVERSGGQDWLRPRADRVAKASRWIARETAKTRRLDARGGKVPEHGLLPPGVTADWGRFAYRFFNDVQYQAGLEGAARALASVGHAEAPALLEAAREYREDLIRAYRWTQARSPVVPLRDGRWVPASPALLESFGLVEDFLPGEDGNRSWAYSVEIGAHHQIATGLFPAHSPDADWIVEHLEDEQFLRTGMGYYPERASRRDPLRLGGFGKVQPFYARIAEVYALRDEAKPFLRSYFNSLASLVSRENLSFWEHFHNIGGWNKTHETGWFLCQTRILFVEERGEDLWLAPFVARAWLRDGRSVSVRRAPTRFGHVEYEIESKADSGAIVATVRSPMRAPPRQIVLRLRHPEEKRLRRVFIGGVETRDFDAAGEWVRFAPLAGEIRVEARYD